MNNLETAKGALNRAKGWHKGALRAFNDKRWDDVIYSYQMTIEQALKAILILYGIEYPKKHDISKEYKILKDQEVPKWFLDKIDNQSKILKELTNKRGLSAYGYVDGIVKDDFKEAAKSFKKFVKEILEDCEILINEFSTKNTE